MLTVCFAGGKCVIKSQILKGGRGKGTFDNGLKGGVRVVEAPEEGEKLSSKMLGHRLKTKQTSGDGILVEKLLVAEFEECEEEWYLAITLDREQYSPVVLISRSGGVDIEDTAKSQSGSLKRFHFNFGEGITPDLLSRIQTDVGATPAEAEKLSDIVTRLWRLFVSKDATLLEINPLARTGEAQFKCLDAKFTVDDASQRRQPELFAQRDVEAEVPEELEAQKYGLVYIKMEGNIGNVVNGAGLAMATNDAIAHHGGASANFLDAGGQATKETMQKAFEIILRDQRVKVILVNIYGGIIKCDMIAESIIGATKDLGPLRVPLVVRLQGTNSPQGLKILEDANLGFHVESGFGEAAQKAVELAKSA
ncbi:beta-succinyl synthetase precursor [Fusarium beomiforme]|uniref:Succinyl-CoA synthetase beta chain n=1 Tax=Fusarium beomiforme TaxID=44412 RepID=A0A9P5AVN2_9HYPO|nr:beta-succinyl synthetase precursor [Fusarium beomiforme]